jgi:hypothetical protein
LEYPEIYSTNCDLRNYILLPTIENVLHMLEKVQMSDKVSQLIQTFNNSINHEERSQFVAYIPGYSKMNYHVPNYLTINVVDTLYNSFVQGLGIR